MYILNGIPFPKPLNKTNFEYMAYGVKKGLALKLVDGEQMLDIHLPTLVQYLSTLPKDAGGWHRFRMTLLDPDRPIPEAVRQTPTTHNLTFVNPRAGRQVKITGPTEFKKAG